MSVSQQILTKMDNFNSATWRLTSFGKLENNLGGEFSGIYLSLIDKKAELEYLVLLSLKNTKKADHHSQLAIELLPYYS